MTGRRPIRLGDEAELDQIVGFYLAQQGTAGLRSELSFRLLPKPSAELIGAAQDVLIQAIKGTAADEQDVGGVDLDELLLGVLAAAAGRHVAHSALQDLQQRPAARPRRPHHG